MQKALLKLVIFSLNFFTLYCSAYNLQDLTRLQETCSCPNCDLSFANLADFTLGNSQTLKTKATVRDKNGFITCNLQNANFKGSNLKNAYFSQADFGPGIYYKVAKVFLQGANFTQANLQGAHFNAVMADGTNFRKANLRHAHILKAASFQRCNFSHAQMQAISISPPMSGCGAMFNHSNFSHANLSRSRIIADFTGANFSFANLSHAQLTPCDNDPTEGFQNTNFFAANLRATTYNNQEYTEKLLINARLCHTKLSSGVSNRDCLLRVCH